MRECHSIVICTGVVEYSIDDHVFPDGVVRLPLWPPFE